MSDALQVPAESTTTSPWRSLIEGVELTGAMNVSDEEVLCNIEHSCRLGYAQLSPQPKKMDRIVLVGGGPSLNKTEKELIQLVHEGAKLVTTNGAYKWCLDRNLRPSAQIVLDARESNARFLEPEVPNCAYYIASQCHPATWAAVEGRPRVAIWHSVSDDDVQRKALLDRLYLKRWVGVGGGITVITRAIGLLRLLGYLRFDLFGVDSCWDGDQNHAFPQPENDSDRRLIFRASPTGRPDLERLFICSPWHVKQLDDFLLFIANAGHHFALNVHGDGLIAYALQTTSLDIHLTEGDK